MPKGTNPSSTRMRCLSAAGAKVFPAKYADTCWSLVAPDDGRKVGVADEPTPEKITTVSSFNSQTGEDEARRKATCGEQLGRQAGIFAEMFD